MLTNRAEKIYAIQQCYRALRMMVNGDNMCIKPCRSIRNKKAKCLRKIDVRTVAY